MSLIFTVDIRRDTSRFGLCRVGAPPCRNDTDRQQMKNPLKRCFKGFCLILSSKLLDLERKTRLELALKIQISHSFSVSCSNNLHQTNKRLRYQSQIYKKSQNTPKTIQNYHKKSTSILKTSQINYYKLYHKLTNHVRYWLYLIYMDY